MKLDYLRVAQSSVDIGDPHICSDSINRNTLLAALYDSLVYRVGQGYFKPALAWSWAVQPDGLTWLFRVRPGVRFHNGDGLTSDDIVASFKRVVDPSIGGAYGTQGVYAGYLGDAKFESTGDDTFSITTSEPMADLLDILAEIPIAPGDYIDRLPHEYIGSGPYQIGSIRRGEVVLERNRDNWGKEAFMDEVTFIEEPDPGARSEMVLERDVNIGALIPYSSTKMHEGSNRTFIRSLESSLCIIFIMNAMEGPCRNRLVRQALSYGVDVDTIIDRVKHGAASKLTGYITPHHFGYNPDTQSYPFDPERAKDLLREAGYTDGLKLGIDVPTEMPDEAPELGEALKEHYATIGVDVDLIYYRNRSAYAEMVRDKRIHDLCCFDSSPLSTFRVLKEKIHSRTRGPWWEGYSNSEVDQLIDRAQRTFDRDQREGLYRRIFQLIRDDAPWLFLYRPTYFWAVSSELVEWTPLSTGLIRLAD